MKREFAINRGLDLTRDDLRQIVELNKAIYGADLTAPLPLVEAIHGKNPDICLLAKEKTGSRAIAYISALPLTDSAFARMMNPMIDEAITPDDIVDYDYEPSRRRIYHLYIASIAVDPSFRGDGLARTLYGEFLGFLLKLGKSHNILFRDIAARATSQGEKICRSLGMRHLATTGRKEEIFHLPMLPPALRDRSGAGIELIRFYQDAFRKMQAP